MAKILIIRFSALGDVAMTVPVVYSLAESYPDLEITFLSNERLSAFFDEAPVNIRFMGVDLKKDYAGLSGLNRLYQELNERQFDYVADLHDVLRSKYLRLRFWLSGVKTAHINKGRKEKKELVRRKNKVKVQLKTSFARYADVFSGIGFPVNIAFSSIFSEKGRTLPSAITDITGGKDDKKWIGIAPLAKHLEKTYPTVLMQQVIKELATRNDSRVILFGGKDDSVLFSKWKQAFPSICAVNGKLTLSDELRLINSLDVMVSMDSANMHFASLVNTPVISIWGATHPFAGFLGWNQSLSNTVQVDLFCRPCSVFGNKKCYRGDWACMNTILPANVVTAIDRVIY